MLIGTPALLGGRSGHFLKVAALTVAIQRSLGEVLLWMDHDAWFEQGLVQLVPIEHYLVDSADIVFPDLTYDLGPIRELCTAVFLVRATPWTMELLEAWWRLSLGGGFNLAQTKDQIPLALAYIAKFTEHVSVPIHMPPVEECLRDLLQCKEMIENFFAITRRSSLLRDATAPVQLPHLTFATKNHWPSLMSLEFAKDYLPTALLSNSFAGHSGSVNYNDHSAGNIYGLHIPSLGTHPHVLQRLGAIWRKYHQAGD